MPDFLTHDVELLVGVVIRCLVEVGVVHLSDTLGNVTPRNPYLCEPEPAVVAVCPVANLDASRLRLAISTALSRDNRRV